MNYLAKKRRWTLLLLVFVLSLPALPAVIVWAQQGGSVDLSRNVIAGGGNTSTGSGNTKVSGTSGQSAAGAKSSGGSITEKSGFWHAVMAPPASPTPTPQPGAGSFEFTSATYTVNEDCTETLISVKRSNGSSGSATVDFSITNGTGHPQCLLTSGNGSQNCDFSYTSGTLSFANAQISKSFRVLISKDAYIEGDENIGLALLNPTAGATIGGLSTATLTIIDNNAVPTDSQPIDDTPIFVGQHYHDFLARSADPGGAAFWQSQITQCGNDQNCIRAKRIDVSNAFFFELEYQQTGSYVFRLYRAAYGDNQPFPNTDNSNPTESKKIPSYAVFLPDRARVIGGANLAQAQLDLANVFVSRPEFLARYPASLDGVGFVAALVQNLQAADGIDLSSETAGLQALYNNGGRGAVLYRLADDNQTNPINNHSFIDAEYNRAFVTTQYFGYLRRNADIGGYLFWLSQMNSAPLRDVAKQHAMVCSFVTSIEYQNRFSAMITHSNAECP